MCGTKFLREFHFADRRFFSILLYLTFDPGLTVTDNFIFYTEGAQCLQAPWFLFGLPRHFHFLLYICLVLSLVVFCGK